MFSPAFLGAAVFAVEDMNIIEILTGTIADASSSIVIPLAETIDTTSTFPIILGGQTDNQVIVGSFYKVELTSTDATITCGTPSGITDFNVMIVSSKKLASLQFVTWSVAGGNATGVGSITAVDSINNDVIVFSAGTQSVSNGNIIGGLQPIISFTQSESVTSLTARRAAFATGGTWLISAYIAEFKK